MISISDSPIAALNRAIALQHRDGPAAALAALEPMADRLDAYHLYHAARAQILRTLGRSREAASEDRRASRLTTNQAELSLLQKRIDPSALVALDGGALGG